MVFQSDTPMIHKVYFIQFNLVKQYFSYFISPDHLDNVKRGSHLTSLSINESLLPKKLFFVGARAKKLSENLVTKNKLIIKLIRSPNSIVLKRLLNLPSCIKVLSNDQEEVYEKEVRKLFSFSNLPESGDLECLAWWKLIKHSYPCLFKVVTAALSVFHGPRIKSSFNVMGDVMDKKSSQMNMETYSSFQDVKYGLKVRKPKSSKSGRSVEYFSREDKYFSPVDKSLARNMRNASELYTKKKSEKRSLANGDHDGDKEKA